MQQVVSLVKDDHVTYALVDGESGDMTTFATIMLPDPDRFGLHEAAVLGTNLITALNFNGHRRRAVAKVEPQLELEPAPEPPQVRETAREKRNRLAREKYASGRQRTERTQAHDPGSRTLTDDEVLAVIRQYPIKGISSRAVAERIWRGEGRSGEMPFWLSRAVDNKVTKWLTAEREGRDVAPVTLRYAPRIGMDGRETKLMSRYLVPRVVAP